VYLDPIAEDGFPFKIFARTIGTQRYVIKHLTLVSRDGVHWQADDSASWNQPHWHPEPPIYGFYNHHTRRHVLTSRPGHGDRRVTILSSPDARNWSTPELLLQPDPSDAPLVQFYGLPVFAYEGHYIGFLWTMHCDDSAPPASFNHFVAPMDSELAYSFDGIRFQRSFREPFIPRGSGGLIQPSAMIDAGDELRIYSTAGLTQHGMGRRFSGRQQGL
ncbi:MAG: hypothetical protein GY953_20215, partial [bacterium]|nr:hypothetical protein [bacterium]